MNITISYLPDLIARKLGGPEQSTLTDADIAFHEEEYQRLRDELQAAHEASGLIEVPAPETRAALTIWWCGCGWAAPTEDSGRAPSGFRSRVG